MAHRSIEKIIIAGLVIGLSVVAFGCSEDGSYKDPNTNNGDGGTEIPPGAWTIQTVEDEDVGLQVQIDVGPDGKPAVAYWDRESYEDGVCDLVPLETNPARYRQDLRFATRSAGGDSWSTEVVDSPTYRFGPAGLSFAFSPSGQPAIAYKGGEPNPAFTLCGSSDAVLATKAGQNWTTEAAGTDSGDSVTGLPESDNGYIVGVEPALAFDPDGNPAILHRDTHFQQGLDTMGRSDAEFAWRNSGSTWLHEAVDPAEGAGYANALVFDSEGRPVAFYQIPTESNDDNRYGVWGARRETDGTWTQAYLHIGAIDGGISAAVDPVTGEIAIAFYSVLKQGVYVMRLTDPENFDDVVGAWDKELVSSNIYDEGLSVSLAFTPDGQAALAYHRCKRFGTEGGGCNINDEAVVFAMEGPAGWSYEPVKRGTDGSCGEYVSLAIADNGTAYVAFRCTELIESEYVFRLYVAEKAIGGAS